MPGRAGMFVEVTLVRVPAMSNQWNIIVHVQGSSVRTNQDVRLQCGQDVLTAAPNARGEALFEDIPNAWVLGDNPADLHVSVGEAQPGQAFKVAYVRTKAAKDILLAAFYVCKDARSPTRVGTDAVTDIIRSIMLGPPPLL